MAFVIPSNRHLRQIKAAERYARVTGDAGPLKVAFEGPKPLALEVVFDGSKRLALGDG